MLIKVETRGLNLSEKIREERLEKKKKLSEGFRISNMHNFPIRSKT